MNGHDILIPPELEGGGGGADSLPPLVNAMMPATASPMPPANSTDFPGLSSFVSIKVMLANGMEPLKRMLDKGGRSICIPIPDSESLRIRYLSSSNSYFFPSRVTTEMSVRFPLATNSSLP